VRREARFALSVGFAAPSYALLGALEGITEGAALPPPSPGVPLPSTAFSPCPSRVGDTPDAQRPPLAHGQNLYPWLPVDAALYREESRRIGKTYGGRLALAEEQLLFPPGCA
jgi:hypothetical protein